MPSFVCELCSNQVFKNAKRYRRHCTSRHGCAQTSVSPVERHVSGSSLTTTSVSGPDRTLFESTTGEEHTDSLERSTPPPTTLYPFSIVPSTGFSCSKCETNLAINDELNDHLKQAHDCLFCDLCSLWVPSMELKQHYKTYKDQPKCRGCSMRFLSVEHLVEHNTLHKACKRCHECIPKEEIREHYKSSEAHPTCPECYMSLNQKSYNKHIAQEHTISCSMCDLKFCKQRHVNKHQRMEHAEQSEPSLCVFCVMTFNSNIALRKHVEGAHHNLYCAQCNLIFFSGEDNLRHVAISHKHQLIVEATCEKDIQTDPQEEKHELATRSKQAEPDADHSMDNFDSPEMTPSRAKVFCSSCRLFVSGDELESHFNSSPNHPSCHQCDIGFENNVSFTKHTFTCHAELRCETCGLAFQDLRLLGEHYADSGMHTSCSQCNHGFKDEISLQEHLEAGCLGSTELYTQLPDIPPFSEVSELDFDDGNENTPSPVSLKQSPFTTDILPTALRECLPSVPGVSTTSVLTPSLVLSDVAAGEEHADSLERNSSRIGTHKSSMFYNPISRPLRKPSISGGKDSIQDIGVPLSIAPALVVAHQAEPIESSFHCRVCEQTPDEPVAAMCGHLFCLRCLVQELTRHGRCPACDNTVLIRLQI